MLIYLTVHYFVQMATKPDEVNRTELLQKALLEYLAHGSENNPSLVVGVNVIHVIPIR